MRGVLIYDLIHTPPDIVVPWYDIIPNWDELMGTMKKINRLKVVLVEHEISHKQFAQMVKKTPNTITRICNNQQQPSLIFLREMAETLNINVCDLLVPVVIRKP